MVWEMLCEQRWLGRVEDAMNDLVAALVDSNAGMVTAKAIGYDDRCNESFSVVLLDDQYVGTWVDCATGDALFGVRRVTEATAPSTEDKTARHLEHYKRCSAVCLANISDPCCDPTCCDQATAPSREGS